MSLLTALEHRVARDGARPLLTWYEPASGARTEFSAVTFANWVDKTANLLDEWGCDEDATVAAPLLLERPGHWVSLVWALATWQRGARLLVVPLDQVDDADVVVVGPSTPVPSGGHPSAWVACSLHPLGLGLAAPVAGATDFREVLSQPDLHVPASADPSGVWLVDEHGSLTGGGVDQLQVPTPDRLLIVADDHRTVLGGFASVVQGGGSLVVVDGTASDDQLVRIATSEKAQAFSV